MIFKLAWKNISSRPLSTGLSIVLLSSSIMVIVLANLTINQMKLKFNDNANKIDLVIGAKGSRLQLILCNVFHIDYPTGNILMEDIDFLNNHPFVKNAVPISLGDAYQNHRIIGTNKNFILDIYNADLEIGELFKKSFEVVIGSNVANQLKLNIGSSFIGSHGLGESLHMHDDFKYVVVGILKPTGEIIDELIITPLESIWNVHLDDHDRGSFDLKTAKDHDLQHL